MRKLYSIPLLLLSLWCSESLALVEGVNPGLPNVGLRNLLQQVSQQFSSFLQYPPAARRRGQAGGVILSLKLNLRSGEVIEPEVHMSSGYSLLDNAALDALKRASPFTLKSSKELPDLLATVQIPVMFKLTDEWQDYLDLIKRKIVLEGNIDEKFSLDNDTKLRLVLELCSDGEIFKVQIPKDLTNEDLSKRLYAAANSLRYVPPPPPNGSHIYLLRCSPTLSVDLLFSSEELSPRKDNAYAVLYKKACDSGMFQGCYWLAQLYLNGDVLEKNLVKVIELLDKSCGGGYARGCNSLGVRYARGEGVERDQEKALQLFSKACELKDQVGCSNHTEIENQ